MTASSSAEWRASLLDRGYAYVRGLVPGDKIDAALALVREDLRLHYDEAREDEYSSTTYFSGRLDARPLTDLLELTLARNLVDETIGWESIGWQRTPPQVAIRWARNVERAFDPEPHVDGSSATGVSNFTAVLGVFLTTTPREFAGNLAVWPGSHRALERYFRERGPRAVREPLPSDLEIGQTEQLLCDAGDAVLMHWSLAHQGAVNTSNVDRIAVYFRLAFPILRVDHHSPATDEERYGYLSNLWRGWRIDPRAR